jgi:hypothetical protein
MANYRRKKRRIPKASNKVRYTKLNKKDLNPLNQDPNDIQRGKTKSGSREKELAAQNYSFIRDLKRHMRDHGNPDILMKPINGEANLRKLFGVYANRLRETD